MNFLDSLPNSLNDFAAIHLRLEYSYPKLTLRWARDIVSDAERGSRFEV